jgi:predicted polyphosphate/ATP-dependent NAD kinase
MATPRDYNIMYIKHILGEQRVPPASMVKSKFYSIQSYTAVDGNKYVDGKRDAPVVFTLFVSKSRDIVHCIKITEVNPSILKRFFKRLTNFDTREIELAGTAKKTYQSVVSKFPGINEGAYRTYKLSGINKVVEVNMDVRFVTSARDKVVGINDKFQVQNK